MSFWRLSNAPDNWALLWRNGTGTLSRISRAGLATLADTFSEVLANHCGKRALGFVLARNNLATVAAYIGALRGDYPLALLPAALPADALDRLLDVFAPDWLFVPGDTCPDGYSFAAGFEGGRLCVRDKRLALAIHPELALLLSTSGTTGSPKMVRLSRMNLAANAQSIANYLGLDPGSRAITTLPVHYSYGLSVLNSHLSAGAATILTDESVASRPFWDDFREGGADSLAGVPTTWQMLQRLRIERMDLPRLSTLTQAGGRLSPELTAHFSKLAAERGWRFFVMYGQTEATARIAYVPPERLAGKIGAIGIAIPGGELSLSDENELIYRGPNVMQGYAESRAELAHGDVAHGELRTGDLARCDADGFYWLTGRIKRIAKVFGNRVNLDEVEALLETRFGAGFAALDADDVLHVVFRNAADVDAVLAHLRERLGLHPSGIRLTKVDVLPLTASGKIDYPLLRERLDQGVEA